MSDLQKQQPENQSLTNQNQNQETNESQKIKPSLSGSSEVPFKIGIIVNGYNYDDLKYYNEQFKSINKLFTRKEDGFQKVVLVFFGYRPEDDKENALDGVNFEYVKPVSFIHYFKQLKALNLNLLFIPLIPNAFNNTSENYNKFLEVGLYGIATLAPDVYPYNSLIKDKQNGFMFGKRENFITYLIDLFDKKNFGLIKVCGEHAHTLTQEFNYSKKNMKTFSDFFEFPEDDEVEGSDNEGEKITEQ